MIDRAGPPAGDIAADGPDEMGRELASGPEAVAATLSALRPRIGTLREHLSAADSVHVIGTGASLAVARCAEPLLRAADRKAGRRRDLLVREAAALIMALPGEESCRCGDLVVAVSRSGKSPEVLAACRYARAAGARVLAVTSGEASPLAELADDTLHVPIGEEHGAATKSALGGLAALLAMWGLVGADPTASRELVRLLRAAVNDWPEAWAIGRELASARRTWFAGFGSGLGVAEAAGLLWHEKVHRLAVATTPSGFRHGLIEAASDEDAIVLVEVDPPLPVRAAYMRLLSDDCRALGLLQVTLTHDRPPAGRWLALRAAEPPGRALESLVRVQQLARATALAGGSYSDGFVVLNAHVWTSAGFE